jgi:hypothetical protein
MKINYKYLFILTQNYMELIDSIMLLLLSLFGWMRHVNFIIRKEVVSLFFEK